jgi:hypothetical protein
MLPSTFPNIIFHENSTACNDIIFPESIPWLWLYVNIQILNVPSVGHIFCYNFSIGYV